MQSLFFFPNKHILLIHRAISGDKILYLRLPCRLLLINLVQRLSTCNDIIQDNNNSDN